MIGKSDNTRNQILFLLLVSFFFLTSCQLFTRVTVYDDFVVVHTRPGDTFSSLAADYLDDPEKGWVIAEFNEVETVPPDQDLIIPLKPFNRGGLKATGYQTIPVLSYHRVSAAGKVESMTIPQKTFEAQMNYLKENGYAVITIDQFFEFLNFNFQAPPKSVVLTFDDGWKSIYEVAYPILKKYNFPATLFVYTDLIGTKRAMSWAQVKELSENGFAIHSHSKTHRNLARLKKGESFGAYYRSIEQELHDSKKVIVEKVGAECNYFAYAYGAYNPLMIAMLKKYGYHGAFTVKRGANPFFKDQYTIHRSMIYGKYGIDQFKKNLKVFRKRKLK